MLTIPGPSDLFTLAVRGRDTLETALGLLPRLFRLVADIEQIVVRVNGVIAAVDHIESRAGDAVGEVEQIVTRVGPLLDRFEPLLDKLEPIASKLVDTTSPDEVEAVVQLVNHLPELVDKIDNDVLPILDTLGTVAPDLRELLTTSKELNEIVASIPGLGRMRKHVRMSQD